MDFSTTLPTTAMRGLGRLALEYRGSVAYYLWLSAVLDCLFVAR
jgi:hypothetical protein